MNMFEVNEEIYKITRRRIRNSVKYLQWKFFANTDAGCKLAVKYFGKKVNCRCLTGFLIRLFYHQKPVLDPDKEEIRIKYKIIDIK